MFQLKIKLIISILGEEKKKVESYLQNYKDVDEKLWDFDLKDDLVDSVLDYIGENEYDFTYVQGILEENIIPDLKKLGLEDFIPKLKDEVNTRYKDSMQHSEINNGNDINMEFRDIDFSDYDIKSNLRNDEKLNKKDNDEYSL